MYAIKENNRILQDNTEITTFSREVTGCNTLEVEAGTTGFMGGDTGHGCRTYIRIENLGGSDLRAKVLEDLRGYANGIELTLGGDSELATTIEALEFVVKVLKSESKGKGEHKWFTNRSVLRIG